MMPYWATLLPWDKITAAADLYQLSPYLVGAIVAAESAGFPYAIRYERTWEHFLTPEKFARELGLSVETEKIAQAISWGLMQVMGGTAREMGFTGYLPELCRPEIGLRYGCRYLKNKMTKYKGDIEKAVAAYNAGTAVLIDGKFKNQGYVDKVMKNYYQVTPSS